MHKIQKIGNVLVITNVDTDEETLEVPAGDVYAKVDQGIFNLYHRDRKDQHGFDIVKLPVDQCVDEGDVAFTEATLKTWSRENLAFSGAGGSASTTAIEGVERSILADWTEGFEPVFTNTTSTFSSPDSLGDLSNVETLIFHFERANGTWPVERRVSLDDVKLDINEGFMILHYDNDYIALRMNTGDRADGILRLRASGFAFRITRIEFKTTGGVPTGIGAFVVG